MDTLMVMLILLALISGGCLLVYLQHKTNFYWKFVQKLKWNELRPQLQNIQEIHERLAGTGKKINWIEKNVTKSVKKSFYESKKAYDEYVDFCNEKGLSLPPNQNELEKLINMTEDGLLTPDEALDKELNRSSKQYESAYELVNNAGNKLLAQRNKAVALIENVENLVNSIANHPKSFETNVREINIQKNQFKDARDYGKETEKALKGTIENAGVGVAAGTAVAGLAPSAAMWVATTFGTASTGTAISSLGGAAATNAALAWLGGGSLAAGGGGMAAGSALLALAGPIGWSVAGVSVAVGTLFMWNKKRKIQENKKGEIEYIKDCTEALKEVNAEIDKLLVETADFCEKLQNELLVCNDMADGDYSCFSDYQKEALGSLVNNTKVLSALLIKTVSIQENNHECQTSNKK